MLGQALHAAYQTVPDDRFVHSLHGYFILTGNIEIPIRYEVDIIRDGGSFTTRRVVAMQEDRAIFILAASFQKRQAGFDHQITAPNVLPPEVLLPDHEQIRNVEKIDPELYRKLTALRTKAIEFRPVEKYDPLNPKADKPYRHVWIKATDTVDLPLPMQHQLLAYASDYGLLRTAMNPHLDKVKGAPIFYASLDHAMWFHRDFRIDDWLLYATDSPSASDTRGFTRGNIFDQNGKLVASVAQEGLIRKMRKSQG